MGEKISFTREVYQKQDFDNTININFEDQTTNTTAEILNLPSIPEFFDHYNKLFYSLPKQGELSHTTLVNRSSDYIGNQQTNEEIDALIQEVNGLRETVLEQQQLIFNLTVSSSTTE